MRRRIRRIWAFLSVHGVWAILRAVWRLGVYGRQRVVILAGRLPPDCPLGPAPDDITFRRATVEDLDAMAARRVYVADGEWLHVARDRGRVVGFRRTARSFPAGMLAAVIPPEPHRLLGRETFVHPGYRRHRGLGLRLTVAAAIWRNSPARERSSTPWMPIISRRSACSFGRAPAQSIRFVEAFRCLRSHRYTVSLTMPPEIQRILDEVGS